MYKNYFHNEQLKTIAGGPNFRVFDTVVKSRFMLNKRKVLKAKHS